MAGSVLVIGVSRYLGGALARALSEDPRVGRITGLDIVPPPHGLGRAEFVRADIRSPVVGRVIAEREVDTVVHAGVIATPRASGGRASQKEINVIGTMQLLAACQQAASVRKLVVKSTAGVYGSTPRDPAMFTETMTASRTPPVGWARDSLEVEGYVRGFARRRPDVEITTLRLANVVGPKVRTAITEHFTLPVVPLPLGYDARLQLVHEEDCVAALARAVHAPGLGPVNVAGDGVITAVQAAGLAGRPCVFVPRITSGVVAGALRRVGLADLGVEHRDLLTFGRGLDTTRMRAALGFEPRWSTREAFLDLVRSSPGPLRRPAPAPVEA